MKKINAVAWNLIYEYLKKKDLYVMFIFLALAIFATGYLTFFDLGTESKIMRDIPLFFMPIAGVIVGILLSYDQLDREKKNKTLYPLLAKSITRTEFILGKFWGAFILTECFVLTVAFSYYLFLMVAHVSISIVFLQFLLLLSIKLALVISATLLISVVLTPSATCTIVGLFFLFSDSLAPYLSGLAKDEALPALYQKGVQILFYLMPHTEFFDLSAPVIHDWAPEPFYSLWAIVLYGVIYNTLLLFVAGMIFNRKEL